MTTEELQKQMRRDSNGHLVCEGCGAQVTRGWCYKFGSIVLATCSHPRCQPEAPWVHAVNFVRKRVKKGSNHRRSNT